MGSDSQSPILEQAARQFDVGIAELSPLAGGHYAQVYQWVRDGQGYVLKIAPVEQESDLQSMRAMLAWLAYLTARGAPVVRPIYSRNGSLVERIEHEGQPYLVSASERITGARAETLLLEQWDAGLIGQLGRAVGRCHAAAQDYAPSSPALRRPAWDQATNCFNPADDLATADAVVIEKRAQVLNRVQALPKDWDSYGLAHLDIHFANFIVDPERGGLVLIDFDDCAYGWYVMDVAMLVFDVLVVYDASPRETLAGRFLEAFLQGYRAEKELDAFWIAQLPAFLKLLEIGVYAMLARDYDAATCQDEWVNTFMRGRERRIREGVPYLDGL
jgi:Ser/Thr protein kinase RdoA (MazF antagonist)